MKSFSIKSIALLANKLVFPNLISYRKENNITNLQCNMFFYVIIHNDFESEDAYGE